VAAFRGRPRRTAASSSPTPLDGLLQDVRDLRLTLAADLNAAAGAAEAGAPTVAGDILDADRRELIRFAHAAELRIARMEQREAAQTCPSHWRRRVAFALPAVPLVGAMAMSAAALTGTLPLPGHDRGADRPGATTSAALPTSPVSSSFQRLVNVVDGNPSASQVIAAAKALHRQIAALIRSTPGDPANAAEVAELIRMEQSLLMSAQPPGADVVLDATRRLAEKLVTSVPAPKKPAPKPTDISTQLAKPSPSATKSPSPSPSPTATKTSTSSPKPSESPSPTQSSGPSRIPALP
jgi:hypothetical protein